MKRVDASTSTPSRQTFYTVISRKVEWRLPITSRRLCLALPFGILDRLPNGRQHEHAFQVELGESCRKQASLLSAAQRPFDDDPSLPTEDTQAPTARQL